MLAGAGAEMRTPGPTVPLSGLCLARASAGDRLRVRGASALSELEEGRTVGRSALVAWWEKRQRSPLRHPSAER